MNASLLLAAAALAAAAGASREAAAPQDASIQARSPGPGLAVPPPEPAPAVVDEVLDSLLLGRGRGGPAPARVGVTPEPARAPRPFPEPPYLALSPANIEALYDAWIFEVFDGLELVFRSEGIGLLQEPLEWAGEGSDGRTAAVAGRGYRYRFTGRRGSRSFLIDSEPVRLDSLSRPEFSGATRLEAAASALFKEGQAEFADSAKLLLDALVERLRPPEARPGGVCRLAFYAFKPRSAAAKARAEALSGFLTSALRLKPSQVEVSVLPAESGEILAVVMPPSSGPIFQLDQPNHPDRERVEP
ncbi:MAG: hypothetical protein HY552_06895 [Elusimicrobia bacterium]|nr:hypothetical protein [Elusimicrobiota bacterium]